MTNRSQLSSSAAAATATATTNDPFIDVLATFSQRMHHASLSFFEQQYPELVDYLNQIPRKIESRTVWNPKVRFAIIQMSEALGVDLSQYAPFDLRQPFNSQGVRRMLPRLALLVAGRMTKEDISKQRLRFWLRQQRHRESIASSWKVTVCYSDGRVGPPLY